MAVNGTYLNAIADDGNPITFIGLTDSGTEVSGGTYIRQAVTWTAGGNGADDDGQIRPDGDLAFDIPSGATVDGWQGYSAETAGTAYGVTTLTAEAFAGDGTYTLLAASTAINHDAA